MPDKCPHCKHNDLEHLGAGMGANKDGSLKKEAFEQVGKQYGNAIRKLGEK